VISSSLALLKLKFGNSCNSSYPTQLPGFYPFPFPSFYLLFYLLLYGGFLIPLPPARGVILFFIRLS
jgi:hypothetical protein